MTYSYSQPTGGFGLRAPQFATAATGRFSEVTPGPLDVIGGFGFDRADLGPPQLSKIAAVAARLMAQTVRAIRLVGHTDTVGTAGYNQALGQRRAEAVRRALLAALDRLRPGAGRTFSVNVESAGELRPVARERTEVERALNRRVEIFVPGQPPPLPQPVTPTTTHTVRVVLRSSILRVGSAVGAVRCPLTIAPVPIPGLPPVTVPSSAALRAFAAMLDRVVSDHIRNDAKDRMYRLFSDQSFRVVCQNGQILSVTPAGMDTDVGQECLVAGRACLTPPPLVVTGLTVRRTAPDAFAFSWTGKGRPHNLVEPSFQAICARTSRFIWHSVSGSIRCSGGGIAVGVQLTGSRFPTHAAFVNGALRASLPQGTLSQLWDPHPSDPTMVR
jgi:OmpA family